MCSELWGHRAGLSPKLVICALQGTEYQLRLSLFDATYHHFFGRTWRSSWRAASPAPPRSARATFNEVGKTHNQTLFHPFCPGCIPDTARLLSFMYGLLRNWGAGFPLRLVPPWEQRCATKCHLPCSELAAESSVSPQMGRKGRSSCPPSCSALLSPDLGAKLSQSFHLLLIPAKQRVPKWGEIPLPHR